MLVKFNQRYKKFTADINLLRTLRLIWSVARGWTSLIILLIIIEGCAFLGVLFSSKRLINTLAQPASVHSVLVHQFTVSFLATVAITVFYVTIKIINSHVTEIQATKVGEYINDKIHDSAVKLDLSFYESPSYFDKLKRAMDAGPEKPNSLLINLVDLTKNAIMLITIGSVIESINWALLPLLFLFIIPTFLVKVTLAKKLHNLWLKQTHSERKSAYLSSLLTGDILAKEVRSFGLGNYFKSLYLNIRMNLIGERIKVKRRSSGIEIITTVLATLGFFACIGYICMASINGRTSIGDITLFMAIFPQTFALMQQISAGISQMYSNGIFVNNVFELFDLEPTLKDTERPIDIPANKAMDIVMNNVSFTYPHAEKPALKNVSIKIPSGKIVAVIGFNGAGKTTLIKLLCRLYDPTSGNITMDGVDIRKFSTAGYRKQISTVFQDFGRYNFSVKDNIRFGDIARQFNEDDMAEAAKNSGADLYIDKFPDGYNTQMGRLFEDGHEVSIGQWQKLAIARALYSKSRFVIFDEATSALDALAEQELFETFRERIGNRAAIIISHRLSTIKHADYIYVLSGGQVKQEGTHEDLIQMQGDYAKLFKKKPELV